MISDSLHAIKTIGVAFRRDRLGYTLRVALLVCTPAIGFYAVLVYFNYSLADFTATRTTRSIIFWSRSPFATMDGTAAISRLERNPPRIVQPHGSAWSFLPCAVWAARSLCWFFVCVGASSSIFGSSVSQSPSTVHSVDLRTSRSCGWRFLSDVLALLCICLFLDAGHLASCSGGDTGRNLHGPLVTDPFVAPVWFRVAAVVFVCAAALLRISWALILPPLFLLFLRRYTYKTVAAALLASVPSILALTTIFRWLCAPYFESPDGISHE